MGLDKVSFEAARQRIQEAFAPAIVRYQGLSTVEHMVVMGLVWLTVTVLVVVLLVTPLYRWQQEMAMRYDTQLELVAWMKSYEDQFSAGSKGGALPKGQSLQTVLIRDAKGAGITLQRYEPKGATGLRVWINQVAFDDLLKWLVSLNQRFGIAVAEISLEHKPLIPGEVKATVVFGE